MKLCNKCSSRKPLSAFSKNKARKDGLAYACKECIRSYSKEHYKKNIKIYKNKARKWANKAREKYQEYKATLSCNVCGESEPCCLDFHHRDPETKDFTLSKASAGMSLKRIKEEIEKCVVLCSNCHRKVHAGVLQL